MGPRFEEIDAELAALSALRDKPAGTIRITTGEHAAQAILWPALARLLPDYPDIKAELIIDHGLPTSSPSATTRASVSASRSLRFCRGIHESGS